MISEKANRRQHKIPELYLHWTLSKKNLLRPEMTTLCGKALQIHHCGSYNLDNGPDFLNSEISVDGVRMRGDLECHLKIQDWYSHGHQRDRRYERVILHVLWHKPPDIFCEFPENMYHCLLPDMLAIPLKQWLQIMSRISDPPNLKLIPRKNPDLKSLALKRLQRKIELFNSRVAEVGYENTLYQGAARALGYSLNREQFWHLLAELPVDRLKTKLPPSLINPVFLYCLLGWQGGLFILPEYRQKLQNIAPEILVQLNNQACHFPNPLFQKHDWNFARLRPMNSPYFRLAALAAWIVQFQSGSLFTTVETVFLQRLPLKKCFADLKKMFVFPLPPALLNLLAELFPGTVLPKQTIGAARLQDMMLNIFLPLLYLKHRRAGHQNFLYYLEDFYLTSPPAQKYNHPEIKPAGQPLTAPKKFYEQQGILESLQKN